MGPLIWLLFLVISGFTFYPILADGKSSSNLDNPYMESYPFKSAIIHFQTKFTEESAHNMVNTYKLDTVMYIEGDKISKIMEGRVPAQTEEGFEKINSMEIVTPDYIYSIDLLNKEGVKVDNPKKYTKAAYDALSLEEKRGFHNRMKEKRIVSFDLPRSVHFGKKLGTDKILGRECDIYEEIAIIGVNNNDQAIIPDENDENKVRIKTWLWKGTTIPLKGTQEGVQKTSVYSLEKVATKIEENAAIPSSIFEVPSDVKITYDEYSSEFSRKKALRRFEYYKTGKWSTIRMKLKPVELKPEKQSGIKTESKK